MLVHINDEILELLKLDNLKETEDSKIMLENIVNAYMVGGIFTSIQHGACDIDKEVIEAFMDYYARKMLSHSIKMMLERQ